MLSKVSRRRAQSAEHIEKKERLRSLVGTDAFPVQCPLWIMDVPDGYRFWYELFNLHRQEVGAVWEMKESEGVSPPCLGGGYPR